MQDKHFEVKADRRLKTDHKNPGHLGASIPGTICDIRIKEGDIVKKNMPLMTIEAMKMENNIDADRAGVVKQIFVQQGATVMEGDNLILIE